MIFLSARGSVDLQNLGLFMLLGGFHSGALGFGRIALWVGRMPIGSLE